MHVRVAAKRPRGTKAPTLSRPPFPFTGSQPFRVAPAGHGRPAERHCGDGPLGILASPNGPAAIPAAWTPSAARPIPGNGAFATPRAVNAGSPGSALARRAGHSRSVARRVSRCPRLLLAAGAHEPLDRRQLERVRDVAAGEHADAHREPGDDDALTVVEARRRRRARRARARSACRARPARTTCRSRSPSRRSARSPSRPGPARAR